MTEKDILSTEVKFLKGVGPMRAEAFKADFGISTFRDLLAHYPFRYIDRTQFRKISEIVINNTSVQLRGKITKIEKQGKGRANRLTALLNDGTGTVQLVWFQGVKWVSQKLILNQEYLVFGKPVLYGRMVNITEPEFERVEAG